MLKRAYGTTYRQQFPRESDERLAMQSWYNEIAVLSRPAMDSGFNRLKQCMINEPDRWRWPSVAGFIGLCRPTPGMLGLPLVEVAWKEVIDHCHEPLEHPWSHRAVYLAGHFTGWFQIRNTSKDFERQQNQKRFWREYQRLVDRLAVMGSLEDTPLMEDGSEPLTAFEKTDRYHEQRMGQIMEDQGINPKGGREEFLKRARALGLSL